MHRPEIVGPYANHGSRFCQRVRWLPSVLASVFLLVAWTTHAFAELTGEQAVAAADASKVKLPPDALSGVAAFGKLGEDYFVEMALRLSFDREYWGVGVQLPLRFRVVDNDPQDDSDALALRSEDWDEVSDFFRLLRYVYVGRADKKGPFYVRVGELSNLTVGHGTILRRYYNGVDVNRWHTGLDAVVDIGAFGAEAVIGDVTDPYIAGLRGTVRPLELALGEGFWERLVVGATLMTDSKAPFEVASGADEHRRPIVTRDRAFAMLGADVGLEVLDTDIVDVTPYVDANVMTHVEDGLGLHLGVLWALRVPMLIDTFTADLTTEYRRVSRDYVGPYFDTAYEIERYGVIVDGAGTSAPKLRALVDSGGGPGRNGVYLDLLAGFPNFVFVGGSYTDYDGGLADGTLRLSLEVPALQFIEFGAFYLRVNMTGIDDAFALDDRSAVVAEARIPLYSVFTLEGRWWRVWQASGEAVDDWSVGFGFRLEI